MFNFRFKLFACTEVATFKEQAETCEKDLQKANKVRGDFKTQLLSDRQFCLVPGDFHCVEQKKPDGTTGQPVIGLWSRP